MTTLAIMKARIADELARDDLTSQIGTAITTAIEAYQRTRFAFNESRDITFATVADQEFYGPAANPLIPNLYRIDFANILIGNTVCDLVRRRHQVLEDLSNNATAKGQPFNYAYYDKQIRLYPVPTSSTWTVRIAAHVKLPAPATDAETGNAWMTDAERLIRARAKQELFAHVLYDLEKAGVMNQAAQDALDELKGEAALQAGLGLIASSEDC